MRWIMAHVQGVGAMVFQADPEAMQEKSFEFHKPSIVILGQDGQVGLGKWLGHMLKAVGGVGFMNSSAVGFWHYIEENGFIKDCERSWETATSNTLAMPTPQDVQMLRNNGAGMRKV